MNTVEKRTPTGALLMLLFVTAVSTSAFLIFLVQPMVGKRILPWFGGAPSVWVLCLAFFQTALFIGYAYAHGLIRYASHRLQLVIHAAVFAAALVSLPVLPGELAVAHTGSDPRPLILAMLLGSVALPFVALAGTGPLLQAWFARLAPDRSPYPLYAVSNLGSIVALLSYPFWVEPSLTLSASGDAWSIGFAISGALILGCAALAARGPASTGPNEAAPDSQPLRPVEIAMWILLSGCAVVVLMGVTNELCLDMASVPFLWILPLVVYLTTFILSFASDSSYRRIPYLLLTVGILAVPIAIGFSDENSGLRILVTSIQAQIFLLLGLLFGVCGMLHGELHRLRPAPQSLTAFYLCVSGGGALGGLFVGVVAPNVFDDYHEFRFGLALALLLLLAVWWYGAKARWTRAIPGWLQAVCAAGVFIAVGSWTASSFGKSAGVMLQERNFFGVMRVKASGREPNTLHQLLSGTTVHGTQSMRQPRVPTAYFAMRTGIGFVLSQRDRDEPSDIGVVGLGVGTLAAYGRPGDRFRFYEIDPAVIRIARDPNYFSYLESSAAEIEIVEGDGRISLAAQSPGAKRRFDYLVIDAFNSDAIPVHLLTREAFAVYVASIRDGGVIAVHASSQHLDLVPLVARLGRDAGFHAVSIVNRPDSRFPNGNASWVILSKDANRIRAFPAWVARRIHSMSLSPQSVETTLPSDSELSQVPLWTDDHSDLLGVLRPFPLQLNFK